MKLAAIESIAASRETSGSEDTSAPTSGGSPRPRVRIVLVHGTWARKEGEKPPKAPRWFEPGSDFSRRLSKILEDAGWEPVYEEPVLWSAANSLLSRSEGTKRLLATLESMPVCDCLIVAHSYGGNIVLKALDSLNDARLERLRVITLATPFVELFLPDKGIGNYERLQLAAFIGLSVFALATWPGVDALLPRWLLGLICGIAGPIVYLIFQANRKETEAIASFKPCLARCLYVECAFHKFKLRPPRTLILRGVEDEASLAVAAAGMLGRFLQIVRDFWNSVWHGGWRSVLITGSIFAASLAAAIVYAWGVDSGAIESGTFAERLGSALTVLSVMLVSIPLVITGLAVLARSLYGYAAGKELMWLPNLEVSVSTCPDIRAPATRAPCAQQESALREIGANHDAKDKAPPSNLPGTVWAETVPRRGRRLKHIRHSLYDDPAVDTVIDRWAVHAFRHDAPSPGSAHSVPADSART